MISIGMYLSEAARLNANIDNEKGLTLVEVLAALLLLSCLAFSIPAIFGPVATWIAKARMETAAVNYAASMLEELRFEPEKLSRLNSGKTAEELGFGCDVPYTGMIGRISRMEPNSALPGLFEVTATVDWTQAGQPQSMQLVTLIRKEPR